VSVEVSELFTALGTRCADVIVSNPPYLPTGLIASLAPRSASTTRAERSTAVRTG